MDLRPLGLSTVPGEEGALLPDPYSPVILRFDTAMEQRETERILQISSAGGAVEGELHWEGSALCFVPVGGWKPGTRYTLGLSGTVYSRDGRELRLLKYIPFFAVSRAPVPVVEAFSPPDGGSTAVSPEDGIILNLRFSCPMDRRSTEAALSLDGSGNREFVWLEDDRLLRAEVSTPLEPWTVYRWNLGAKALSREGVPLAKAFSGQFITGADRTIPRVLRVYPVYYAAGVWRPRGDNLDTGPGAGEGIGLEFNKAMDRESVLRALSFEPALPGRIEQPGPGLIVFIPERDPEPEAAYTLKVSGDTRDATGLAMGADYTLRFTTDIPFLKIVSLTVDGGTAINMAAFPEGGVCPAPLDPSGGVLRFALKFSLPLNPGARVDTALGISLVPFFPATLPPVSLRFTYWYSDEATLRMEWEGLEPGAGETARYYRLSIPGGRNGVNTGEGSFLKENRYLYLEAVPR